MKPPDSNPSIHSFTHHLDTPVLPTCLVPAEVAGVVAVAVEAGRSPVPATRKRRMKRTLRKKKRSRAGESCEGTGSSGWAPLTGNSGRREYLNKHYFVQDFEM